jgi:hypothetical protein
MPVDLPAFRAIEAKGFYDGICRQRCREIAWLPIDGGSQDIGPDAHSAGGKSLSHGAARRNLNASPVLEHDFRHKRFSPM